MLAWSMDYSTLALGGTKAETCMTEHTCRICGRPAAYQTKSGRALCAKHHRAVRGGLKAMECFADYRIEEWGARLIQKGEADT
jgi:hypothetical protein